MKPKTSFIQQEIFYNSSEYVKSLGVVWMAISLMMIAVSVTAQPAHNGHVASQNGKHSAEYFNRNAMSGITADPDEPGSVVVKIGSAHGRTPVTWPDRMPTSD